MLRLALTFNSGESSLGVMTASRAVARELRAEIARQQVTHSLIARRLGDLGLVVSPAWVSRRMTGSAPIDLDDLQLLAQVLDVDVERLLTHAGIIGSGSTDDLAS